METFIKLSFYFGFYTIKTKQGLSQKGQRKIWGLLIKNELSKWNGFLMTFRTTMNVSKECEAKKTFEIPKKCSFFKSFD